MTKSLLYVSNIEVPYRSEYFNQLSKKINLTVLYERKKSFNRNEKWSNSVDSKYTVKYLKGIQLLREYSLDLRILRYVFSKKYDNIIMGCYNSPSQLIAILFMRIFRKKYILNIDGEYLYNTRGLKKLIKKFLIKGASKYFVAGEYPSNNLSNFIKKEKIYTYHFSSLTKKEITENSKTSNKNTNNTVLVVGQYYAYKGLDIALKCAEQNSNILYKFIGSNKRSELLKSRVSKMKLVNVEIIPFLEKKDLYSEYQNCMCMLLPSQKECWGLVINEAASFGCPIISTTGSGAAMEFLENKWIVNPGDYNAMYSKINEIDKLGYNKQLLIDKSKRYSIENTVAETIKMLNGC